MHTLLKTNNYTEQNQTNPCFVAFYDIQPGIDTNLTKHSSWEPVQSKQRVQTDIKKDEQITNKFNKNKSDIKCYRHRYDAAVFNNVTAKLFQW